MQIARFSVTPTVYNCWRAPSNSNKMFFVQIMFVVHFSILSQITLSALICLNETCVTFYGMWADRIIERKRKCSPPHSLQLATFTCKYPHKHLW